MRAWQRPVIDFERVFYRALELLGQRLHSDGSSAAEHVEDPLASPVDHD